MTFQNEHSCRLMSLAGNMLSISGTGKCAVTLQKTPRQNDKESRYATNEEFRQIFANNGDALYQLAFLLTGDNDEAERCLVVGIEDSIKSNHVFKDWAHNWAKRAIIQSAIWLLQPAPRKVYSHARPVADRDGHEQISQGQFDHSRVLTLEAFDRFVFVMSVLERYSDYECALLLRCFVQDVRDARHRTIDELANADQAMSRSTAQDVTPASPADLVA
jgi:hypothetical protein